MQPFLLLWLISSAVDSAKSQAGQRQICFASFCQPRPRRWPSFLASFLVHALVLLWLPSLLEALRPEAEPSLWVREMRFAKALRIRIPERLYLASGGRPQAGPAVVRAKARPGPGRSAGRGPSVTVVARKRMPRRFELPPLPRRVSDEQTLLQAQHPPDLLPPATPRLAEMFFWAPQAPLPPAPKAFVMPGYASPPERAAGLSAPPTLELPALEPATPVVRPPGLLPIAGPQLAFARPASMPIRTSASPESAAASTGLTTETSAGDPVTLLSLSSSPRALREVLTVLPGNQLGPLFRSAPGREASRLDSAPGRDAASEAAVTPRAVQPPMPKPAGQVRAAGAPPGAQPASENAAGMGDAAPGVSPPVADAARGTALAIEASRISHPTIGVFDVVVQSSGVEGFPESAGVLSGKPIYSVYLNVGASREWILQYALPAEEGETPEVGGAVVRLGNSSPLEAPYPRLTFRPPIKARPRPAYVMVHGFIDGNGRFEALKVLGTTAAEEAPQILAVLERWEFRPAMKDGRPARVEILLAIAPE